MGLKDHRGGGGLDCRSLQPGLSLSAHCREFVMSHSGAICSVGGGASSPPLAPPPTLTSAPRRRTGSSLSVHQKG